MKKNSFFKSFIITFIKSKFKIFKKKNSIPNATIFKDVSCLKNFFKLNKKLYFDGG